MFFFKKYEIPFDKRKIYLINIVLYKWKTLEKNIFNKFCINNVKSKFEKFNENSYWKF